MKSLVRYLHCLPNLNIPDEAVRNLPGVVVENAVLRVQGSKLKQSGPLLITHWGMSGPAVLKTSAWGARELFEKGELFDKRQINWFKWLETEEDLRQELSAIVEGVRNKQLKNQNPFGLPNRLWEFFIDKIGLQKSSTWSEIGKKSLNRIVNILLNDVYHVSGKTTFKEEFVTAGGVSLADVSFDTMQSRKCKNLYFAGEVLDIDGVTGGFNFQAAWTTGYIAGKLKS